MRSKPRTPGSTSGGLLRSRVRLVYEDPSMPSDKDPEFVPRGAVAFFAAMLVFFAAAWLFFYGVMIHRH